MKLNIRRILSLRQLAPLLLAGVTSLAAQAPTQLSATDILQQLRELGVARRVVLVGAHPDDENTDLIAALQRGGQAHVTYLSLTRGEGGQNAVGPELGENLGILRTGELLAARRIDGADQRFTRAYDYGFSKTLVEAESFWPVDSILHDAVRVIRDIRPQIIMSIWTGTPSDGHGQHQYSGMLARLLMDAAADPNRFKDAGPVWQVSKFVQVGGGAGGTTIDAGAIDLATGRSFHQLAAESRSQHRSQGQGRVEDLGPRSVSVRVEKTLVGGTGLWDGIVADELPARWIAAVDSARNAFSANDRLKARDELARGYGALDDKALGRVDIAPEVHSAARLIAALSGVAFDLRSDRMWAVPGDSIQLTLDIWNSGKSAVEVVRGVSEWTANCFQLFPEKSGPNERAMPGTVATVGSRFAIPTGFRPSQPWFLEHLREGAVYRLDSAFYGKSIRTHSECGDLANSGLVPGSPFEQAQPSVSVTLLLPDVFAPQARLLPIVIPAEYRTSSPTIGEQRRQVLVVPAVSVTPDVHSIVMPRTSTTSREIQVTVEQYSSRPTSGHLSLDLPTGWTALPRDTVLRLEKTGDKTTVTFRVMAASSAKDSGAAVAHFKMDDGRSFSQSVTRIEYPQVDPRIHLTDASVLLRRIDVATTAKTIGYIMGFGDAGADAARSLGANVTMLDDQAIASADLSKYNAIVIGIRAYEARPSLAAATARLNAYARNGGTVIVQYQQNPYVTAHASPYSLTLNQNSRVVDENAAITFALPSSPVLTTPNKLSPSEFTGWIQERGLWFVTTRDSTWKSPLTMNDPGEAPLNGALVVAPVGKGWYVYTGLALFRQFPEGVPSAYRLWANLLSLGTAKGGN